MPNDSRHQVKRRPSFRDTIQLLAAVALAFIISLIIAIVVEKATSDGQEPPFVPMEFRLASESPEPGTIEMVDPADGSSIHVFSLPVVTNRDVESAAIMTNTRDGNPAVYVSLTESGSREMRKATSRHINRPVVILLHGKVHAVLTLDDPLSNVFLITGSFTENEATQLAEGIEQYPDP